MNNKLYGVSIYDEKTGDSYFIIPPWTFCNGSGLCPSCRTECKITVEMERVEDEHKK